MLKFEFVGSSNVHWSGKESPFSRQTLDVYREESAFYLKLKVNIPKYNRDLKKAPKDTIVETW